MLDTRKPNESQKAYAARIIRERIISMSLEPGQIISENELSQTLGISRTPVREALSDLVKIQMVEVMPQRGCRVAFIDYKKIEEARFTRQVLETAILPKVYKKMTPASLSELHQILLEQEQVLTDRVDADADFMTLDNLFHAKLFEIAEMSSTYQMLAEMQIHFDRVRRLALNIGENMEIVREHSSIVTALEAGEDSLAQTLMARHLGRVSLDREAVVKAFPHYVMQTA